ncbi:hypothetical protein [Streptomyces sp. NBC_01244]|uniref:hypothetical protein n=1 Tax=Streptomyces sp. NBC_01244 TaxID=2903797 RepID=UPI002E0FEA4A|nr:hypothetical protein OG247_03950 [Streptomyces sp. NBC_01244]
MARTSATAPKELGETMQTAAASGVRSSARATSAVVRGLVAADTGVALIPRLALGSPRADLVVRPPAGPELAREISVAVLRSTSAGSAQELVSALQEQAMLITARWAATG